MAEKRDTNRGRVATEGKGALARAPGGRRSISSASTDGHVGLWDEVLGQQFLSAFTALNAFDYLRRASRLDAIVSGERAVDEIGIICDAQNSVAA